MVNPIIDWTDRDVWDFLHHYGCDGNPLYQCGRSRIGCIGCPLASKSHQRLDFIQYPKYKEMYIRAFDRMVKARKDAGKNDTAWTSGEAVFHWWTHDIYEDPNQMSFFDE